MVAEVRSANLDGVGPVSCEVNEDGIIMMEGDGDG